IGAVDADADKAFYYTRLGARRGEPTMQAWLAQQYLEGRRGWLGEYIKGMEGAYDSFRYPVRTSVRRSCGKNVKGG
ncbi:hypothetical protein CKO33_10970, partial [Ectothiorhodospira mobilis]|nr:hypothetical protein [Ectothiorhodospira mobilis]